MTSESFLSLLHKDLAPRSSKASQIITESPSLKVCVLVMFFFFFSALWENFVAALI